ncbi:MAG: hypothetical protein JRN15_12265 [Nitrososphaerota archaeon]|nr:hypothetical protein [Nitrososphaerota archaeon]
MKKLIITYSLVIVFLAGTMFFDSCNRESPLSPRINTDTVDVFPLYKGAHFTYLYTLTGYSQSGGGYVQSMSTDSGRVAYTIQDSFRVSATLMLWTVRERDTLVHRDYRGSAPYQMILDSSFLVTTDRIDSLYEGLVGPHELNCSSTVWHFPFADSVSNAVPSITDSIYINIFRYADSQDPILSGTYNPFGDGSWLDQVSFKLEGGVGLLSVSEYQFEGSPSGTSSYRRINAELLNASQ